MICDAQYMMLFEIVIDTALWQYFSDLWWNLIVMDQQIFCSEPRIAPADVLMNGASLLGIYSIVEIEKR